MKHALSTLLQIVVLFGITLYTFSSTVYADHSWGNYHWARTGNPFILSLGDNVNSLWDGHLQTASIDWSVSSVLNTQITSGGTRPKTCKATSGKIEVCSERYGKTGWLGIARIWASGSHITQAVAKMNDTYFASSPYNTATWRQLVMCQEIAHGFGLDHQDEIFNNTNLHSCMDYTSNPIGNEKPNAHDFEQLESIYAHIDTFTTIQQSLSQLAQTLARDSSGDTGNDPRDWGTKIRDNGRLALFEKDLGGDRKILTHVIWASESQDH